MISWPSFKQDKKQKIITHGSTWKLLKNIHHYPSWGVHGNKKNLVKGSEDVLAGRLEAEESFSYDERPSFV